VYNYYLHDTSPHYNMQLKAKIALNKSVNTVLKQVDDHNQSISAQINLVKDEVRYYTN